MDLILQTVIQYVAEIIVLILISALGIFSTWILSKIKEKKNLTNISIAIEQVTLAAQETVRRLQQTVVDGLKELSPNGKLTPEQIQELKAQTQAIVREQLSQPTIDLLTAAKIDLEALITNAAESYINVMKLQ